MAAPEGGIDLCFKVAGQVVVLEQNAIPQHLLPKSGGTVSQCFTLLLPV
jgi:hypothetical protein